MLSSFRSAHGSLPCGIEYGLLPLPERRVVSFQFRVFGGMAAEPHDKLGLAKLVEETIDKGTAKRTGRELSDAFDALGASCGSGTGRETVTFVCTVLPEYFEQAVALQAEFLTTPTFPSDVVEVNVDLARQELLALEDDAHAITEKLIDRQAFGPILGRHALGEKECFDRIATEDLVSYWKQCFAGGRTLAAFAGPLEESHVRDVLQQTFEGFGRPEPAGRAAHPLQFLAHRTHHAKDLQQQQVAVCFPGVDVTHEDFPTQQVMLSILSGGMSGRLFTEVREKQGLVYWVSAWQETPRGHGMIFLGASTTPERCDRTFETLLREVDRLAEDIDDDELDRAITGLVASQETRGDATRARCSEVASDLFFFGRPVSPDEKLAKIRSVTRARIMDYLDKYPRDRLSVVTLGPRPLTDDPKARAVVESADCRGPTSGGLRG